MAENAEPLVRPDVERKDQRKPKDTRSPGYLVICWNDPVNLMAYVTHVFMVVFGWPKVKAERHMMEVHENGRSVLLRDSLERAEFFVHQLQKYSLQATLESDPS